MHSVSFSPEGKTLAIGSNDKLIRLWDIFTKTEEARLKGHENSVKYVSFNRDGSKLASSSYDKSIRVWDVKS